MTAPRTSMPAPTPCESVGPERVPEMGVLIIGTFLSGTNVTRSVCEDLAVRLRERHWKVLTASDRVSRGMRLLDMLWTAWRFRRKYEVAQVDVFSGRAFLWARAVCWVLRRAGKPYVLTLHGGGLPGFAVRHPRAVGALLRSARAVTVPSPYLLEEMAPYRDGLKLIPNGLDLDAYRFRPRERAAPRLVWVRAFHRMYNPSLAPRVLSLLLREFPDARLAMFGFDKGDGSLQDARRVASELGVEGRIHWSEGVPKAKVPAILSEADVFLNTTSVDNSPVSVMEALASGLCVVSTNAGGLPYILTSERDALLVPCDDAEAMAHAVGRVLKEPGLSGRLSRAGRELAVRSDWSRVIPEWQRLLAVVGLERTG
jgi:glycosyltransferase involved in cell wall biosynthesis